MRNNKVLQCFHCGNKTLMELKCSHTTTYDFDDDNVYEVYTWNTLQCPICKKITFEQIYHFSEDIDFDGSPISSNRILYPEINSYNVFPQNIRNAFESALKVKNIDGAICALSLRRTLEMICKDQGDTEGDLYSKLLNLSKRNILPPILNEMATILRKLGNEAAHAADADFSEEVIEIMVEFTKAILEYIYVLPNKLSNIQGRLSREKAQK